ncbi:MAG: hypothetical protein AABW49_01430 [Nanoarchaeota archaeon]
MTLNTLDILATIFAVVILTKLLVVIIKPKWLVNLSIKLLKKQKTVTVTYLALAMIIGYSLLQVIDIVTISAVMLLTTLLFGVGMLTQGKCLVKIYQNINTKSIVKDNLLNILIWTMIALSTLYAVFN